MAPKLYVLQLISSYEKEAERFLTLQNSNYSYSITLIKMHLGTLRQAYGRCDIEQQLYCVNRISRIIGEIDGSEYAKKKMEEERACAASTN